MIRFARFDPVRIGPVLGHFERFGPFGLRVGRG